MKPASHSRCLSRHCDGFHKSLEQSLCPLAARASICRRRLIFRVKMPMYGRPCENSAIAFARFFTMPPGIRAILVQGADCPIPQRLQSRGGARKIAQAGVDERPQHL
jgi:hypothetical protein